MKCTFSCSTRRRAWVSAWSGLQVVSPVTISTLRPPAVMPACSQNSRKPLTISAPGDASGPVIGGRKPIRIGPLSCACADAAKPAIVAAANSRSARELSERDHAPSPFVMFVAAPVPDVARRRGCLFPASPSAMIVM